jgi:tetratricopeptide (TPR) repeat protein
MDRLDSWKEVAAYFKRDVATVRRWEKREGLPVHRHHHHRLGSVYAYPSELDEWWKARSSQVALGQPAAPRPWNGPRLAVGSGLLVLLAFASSVPWLASRQPVAHVSTPRSSANPRAHQLYLDGRYALSQGVGDELRKAAEQFELAIAADPTYGLAYAGLADAYASWANSSIIDSRNAYLKANVAALKALELDEMLAGAHATLGAVRLFHDWDWPAAERAFKRALLLDPNDASTHRRYGLGLMWLGRFDEATGEIQRARALAPADREINANLALVFYFAGQYDAAIREARRTLEMDRGFSQAHRTIARAFLETGLYDQAIAEFRHAMEPGGIQLLTAELGHAYAVAGRRDDALRIRRELDELSKRRHVSPFDMAILSIGLGETDQAFDWLEQSFAQRERWMLQLKVAPVLDPLRSDPRFADLVSRVGVWDNPR